ILDMVLDGKAEPVLVRAVQWHPSKPLALHVDFQRVDAPQAVTTKVPVHYLNADACAAAKLAGQIGPHGPAELDIACRPAHRPRFIEGALGGLVGNARLHLPDVTLPKGVKFVPHGDDTDPLLAQANAPKGTASEGEAEAPAAE